MTAQQEKEIVSIYAMRRQAVAYRLRFASSPFSLCSSLDKPRLAPPQTPQTRLVAAPTPFSKAQTGFVHLLLAVADCLVSGMRKMKKAAFLKPQAVISIPPGCAMLAEIALLLTTRPRLSIFHLARLCGLLDSLIGWCRHLSESLQYSKKVCLLGAEGDA